MDQDLIEFIESNLENLDIDLNIDEYSTPMSLPRKECDPFDIKILIKFTKENTTKDIFRELELVIQSLNPKLDFLDSTISINSRSPDLVDRNIHQTNQTGVFSLENFLNEFYLVEYEFDSSWWIKSMELHFRIKNG